MPEADAMSFATMGLSNEFVLKVHEALKVIGYPAEGIRQDYSFPDFFDAESALLQVQVAAFSDDPPSYRNACLGIVRANGAPRRVAGYRSLGAPVLFEVSTDLVHAYAIKPSEEATCWERIPTASFPDFLRERSDMFSPTAIMRAKGIGPSRKQRQLDFVDLGLLEAVEGLVHRKLDLILQDAFYNAQQAMNQEIGQANCSRIAQIVLRLLAAKIFRDRGHSGPWVSEDPERLLRTVEDFYGLDSWYRGVASEKALVSTVWEVLSNAISFRNLAVDDLAFVYENTLVTREVRQRLAIYSTPPRVAEYVIRRLPLEHFSLDEIRLLEPFAGHGVFLLMAMRRMKELLPPTMTAVDRHRYFVSHLRGIELDPFAREVARLCLTLADYPNPDGWHIEAADVFASEAFSQDLGWANAVVFNPPFDDFTEEERRRSNVPLHSVHKPAEALHRVLHCPPATLGVVLPESFLTRLGYRQAHEQLARVYREIELISLPEGHFEHAEFSSALLMGWDRREGDSTRVVTGRIKRDGKAAFLSSGAVSHKREYMVEAQASAGLWKPDLENVWTHLSDLPRLGEIAAIHRGIEWTKPFRDNEDDLIRDQPAEGFIPGVRRIRDHLRPFEVYSEGYLNVDLSLARTRAHHHDWEKPKVIMNAHRSSRGAWRVMAAADESGIVPYQTCIAIWPRGSMTPTMIAAVLNGPIANGFMTTRGTGRHNQIRNLKEIPIPSPGRVDADLCAKLVQEYRKIVTELRTAGPLLEQRATVERARSYLLQIDALILRAYDLPPRLEKELLNFFQGERRPVPFEFKGYFPRNFEPAVPLHEYLSNEFRDAAARRVLEGLEPISDPVVHELVEGFSRNDGE